VGTYLVTGGTGNVGAFVTKELARRGEQVVAYDLLPNPRALERVLTQEELGRTTLVQGDILDLEWIIRTLKTHRVDAIAHLAAAGCETNPTHGVRINVIGTNNMFEAALITGVPRVLFASSGAVFGPKSIQSDGSLPDDAPYDPQDIYGATKMMNEVVARAYTAQHGLDTVSIFPASYGPVAGGSADAASDQWITRLIEDVLNGRPGTAFGGRGNSGYWLYVEDMARVVVAVLMANPFPSTRVSVKGFPGTNDDLIEIIRREVPGASITVLPGERTDHMSDPDDRTDQLSDIEVRTDDQLPVELRGWKPTIDLEAGVRKIIEYHRAAIAAGS
jgi:nucleoside-diphosphate-sugar epimerase